MHQIKKDENDGKRWDLKNAMIGENVIKAIICKYWHGKMGQEEYKKY